MGKRIDIYGVRLVKESSGIYEIDEKMVKSPRDARDLIQVVLDVNSFDVEKFGVILLNTKNKVTSIGTLEDYKGDIDGISIVTVGTLNQSLVHPREVFKTAILKNSSALILFHNHPSGDPTPSQEDIDVTRKLVDAGKILGIQVMDHVITGEDGTYTSLKQEGYI